MRVQFPVSSLSAIYTPAFRASQRSCIITPTIVRHFSQQPGPSSLTPSLPLLCQRQSSYNSSLTRLSHPRLFSTTSTCLKDKGVDARGKVVVDVSEHPLFKRIPKFLHPYTIGFMNAPVSHVTSFILVHELTAIAPLFGLWGIFYYLDYTPVAGIPDWLLVKGTHFIDILADRNGWTSLKSETGAKIVLQGAVAYAIVKVLLPFRVFISLASMPWVARWVVIPFTRLFTRKGKKSSKSPSSATKKSNVKPPIADSKGQVWTQELPNEGPAIKPRNNANRPEL